MKKVIVSVINDLVTDQRVNRTCMALQEDGYDVLLVGRKLKNSLRLPDRPYRMKRMRLLFTKGALFYAEYNYRLFWFLLFRKADVLHSNDLDTLLANYLASKVKGKPVMYDSHEYFTEVPELEHNAFAKKTWKRIEQWIVPKLQYCFTVNQSIADLFYDDYKVKFRVMRNVPLITQGTTRKTRKELGLPEEKRVLLLQGSGINIHRGAEELVESMGLLDDQFVLYIIGSGDVIEILKAMSKEMGLEEKIVFKGKLPYAELFQYTQNADLGFTLDRDTNLNYRFSLPNKIFDYIQAGIPTLASDLVEVKRIVTDYEIGVVVSQVTPEAISESVKQVFNDSEEYLRLKSNTKKAAEELNWNKEKHVLLEAYRDLA